MTDNIDHLFGFIENRLDSLLQIYIKERTEKGDGLLLIKGDKKNSKVDVGFLTMDLLNNEIKKQIDKLNYTQTKAYFLTYDIANPDINSLIEKELQIN